MTERFASNGKPTEYSIKNEGAIPWASQIVNDSNATGATVADAMTSALDKVVVVSGLQMETVNNEQSAKINLAATQQFTPTHAIVQVVDVGEGDAANGDMQITIGTSAGGTQILSATAMTGLNTINERFLINFTGVRAIIAGTATLYVKVTTADTTAGAGHLAKVYIYGKLTDTAV